MKTRTILASLVVFLAGLAVSTAATNPNMGTWKLNEAKSKLATAAKNNTVVYSAAAGDMIKVTVDGVDKDGKPSHNEWTGKFDGKDYPVTGDPTSDMRAYKMVNDHTLDMTAKKAGKVTLTGTIVVSADGKTRTVNTTGTDAAGKTVANMGFYDKQ